MLTVFTIQPRDRSNPDDRENVIMEVYDNMADAMDSFCETINALYDVGARVTMRQNGYATAVFPRHPEEIGKIGIIPTHHLN